LGKTKLSLEEFKKLAKEGKIVFDQATGTWKWATGALQKMGAEAQKTAQKLTPEKWKEYAQAVLDSLQKTKQGLNQQISKLKQYANQVKSALNEAIGKYNELKEKVVDIDKQIADAEANTQHLMREAYRETMSDRERALDKYREALSLVHLAQSLLKDDPQKARELAKEAQSMFSGLESKYVGLKQKIEGIRVSGEIVKKALSEQKETTLQEMDEQARRIAYLQGQLTTLSNQLAVLNSQKVFVDVQIEKLNEAMTEVDNVQKGLGAVSAAQYGINLDDSSLQAAISNAQRLLELLRQISNTNVQLNFYGKASPVRPLGETLNNIRQKLTALAGIKDVVLRFKMPALPLPAPALGTIGMERQRISERIAVDLNFGGRTYALQGEKDVVREFIKALKKHRLRAGF